MVNEIRDDMLKVKKMVSEVEMIIGKREGESELVNKLIDAENLLTYCMSRLENAIVPPCKVGDTVYIIGLDKKIEKYFVEGICLYQNGLFIEILYNGQGFSLPFNKVFLTKKQAEQKLKEMRGAHNDL